jgi:hypothetical protein
MISVYRRNKAIAGNPGAQGQTDSATALRRRYNQYFRRDGNPILAARPPLSVPRPTIAA